MRPNSFQRRGFERTARRPRFRPRVEILETRVVPSIVDHGGGFASHADLTFSGSAQVTASTHDAQLTNGGQNQAGSFFTNASVDISKFVAKFSFVQSLGATRTLGGGFTLTIQNDSHGAAALGTGPMGDTGITNSVSLLFPLDGNSIGLRAGASSGNVSLSGTGIDLHSGHPFLVTLMSNGSRLTETIQDTSTKATFSHDFQVNLASVIGSHTARVGFTGATGALAAVQNIRTFVGAFNETAKFSADEADTLQGVEGQLLHNVPLVGFTTNVPGSLCTATVDWGDGTTSAGFITGPDSDGVFLVSGTHTYVEEGTPAHGGPFIITVTITCGTASATATVNTNIVDAPLSPTGGFSFSGVVGQSVTGTVATFVDTGGPEDPNDPGDYSATINWGNGGGSSTGTISLGNNGVFTVAGSHTYAAAGTFTITVTIVHETAPPVTVTDTANISGPPLVGTGGFTINGVEGQSFTATVATFTGSANKATIDWGDGTTSAGTITGPDGSGVFTVTGTHTYKEESKDVHGGNPFTITVTISNSTSVTVKSSAFIAEAPLIATGGFTLTATLGQSVTGTVATFIDTGGPEDPNNPGDYSATINWGNGGGSSTGTIALGNNGVFTVTGSHTYTTTGTFIITVTIVHETVSATATSTAIIHAPPLVGTGGFVINGVEGQSFTATVATFTGSANKATIDWGDGTTSAGTITGPDSNGVFTVTGTHTYKEESKDVHGGNPFTITVTISNSTSVTVKSSAFIAEAPLVATGGFNINVRELQPFTATVATFVDTGGPEDPNDPGDYSATINWGDGTTSAGTITLGNHGVFTVTGTHTYAEEGENEQDAVDVFPVTVTIVHETVSATATSTANVSEEAAIASAQGGFVINVRELQPFTATVATFTTLNGETAADFKASINWGDGTTSAGVISGPVNGVFAVTGSHTYAEEGENEQDAVDVFPITVTISDGNSVTVTSTANVAEEAAIVSAQGGFVVDVRELQPFTATVATFTSLNGESAGDFKATINWGDGTTSAGVISGPVNGVFTVTGSHTYAEEGENEQDAVDVFPITVTISDGNSVTVTSTANVAEEAAIVSAQGGFVINVRELQPFTATVATFTSLNGESAGDFKATINWGDGTTSAGVISGPVNGVFTVTGSHTYAEEGENEQDAVDVFPITVTISDGNSVTVTSTANVAEEAAIVSAQGGLTINGVEGQPLQNVTVATFTTLNGESAGDFKATINWGDGTTSSGSITGPSNGVFTVTGSHTYQEEGNQFHGGPFTITVTISDGNTVTVTDTANIAEAPLVATGGFTLNGLEGQSLTGTVATFVDTGGPENPADPGDYTAAIAWGDGTSSTGTVSAPDQNGVFTVTGTHAYTEESNEFHGGPRTITVTITHESAPPVTATSTANIAEAPLVATGGLIINGVTSQGFTGPTVATFVDTGGPEDATLDYIATIDWGDGTTSAGTITGPDQNGVFTVTGDHAYTAPGTFTITVTITHESAPPVTASSTANVAAAAPPMAAAGMNITAEQSVSQDQVVATFVAFNANALVTDFTATIDWGDGSQVDTGTITQPGGPSTPFFVDFNHMYNDVGTFTIHVQIADNGGDLVDVFSTASVVSGPGGGGGARPRGAPLGTRGLHASVGQLDPGSLTQDGSKLVTPVLLGSNSSQTGRSSRDMNDAYWRLYASQEDHLSDPNNWAASQLTLALEASSS